ASPLCRDCIALALEETDRLLNGLGGFAGSACKAQYLRQVDQCLRQPIEVIGVLRQPHGLPRESLGLKKFSFPRKEPRTNRAPEKLREDVVGCAELGGEQTPLFRFLISFLHTQHVSQLRRPRREVSLVAHPL